MIVVTRRLQDICLTSVCDLACKRLPLFTTFSVIIILCDVSKPVAFSSVCLKKVHNLVAQLTPTKIAGETTMLRLVDLSLRINTGSDPPAMTKKAGVARQEAGSLNQPGEKITNWSSLTCASLHCSDFRGTMCTSTSAPQYLLIIYCDEDFEFP